MFIATLVVASAGFAFAQDAPPAKEPAKESVNDSCCRPQRRVIDPKTAPKDRKSVLLRELAQQITDSPAFSVGEGTLRALEQRVAKLPVNAPAATVTLLCGQLGDARLDDGDIEGAIAAFERSRAAAESSRNDEARLHVMRRLALAWMRMGERANCLTRHNQDSCILPLKDGAIHVDRRGSEKAIEVLREILDGVAPNDPTAIWLLNVAHMTLGSWPDAVPPAFLIPPSKFESERPMPRMFDVAAKKGLKMCARAGGSCMDDFDGDGRLDVVASSMDLFEPLRLFHQNEDGTFEDIAAKVKLDGQLGGLDFLAFDANNDGRLDLLVQRGAWLRRYGAIPNSLLIQQPDGTFLDRTKEAGIEIAAPSQVAVAADIDNDGDLDLFLGYEAEEAPESIGWVCRMFSNRGDGTFADVTIRAGVQNERYCKGAAFGDYDGDRYPDLYVSNLDGSNRLYHNNRDGTFTDVAKELKVSAPAASFACWFFDYNNDGWLDLYVTRYGVKDRALEYALFCETGKIVSDTQHLYENDGKGRFRDVTEERGLRRVVFPMGSNFGDIDNDGWPDIYLGTGDPDLQSLWPNVMYHNDAGQRFEDVTSATGTGHLQKGHGVSFGDIDGDGDQDLFEELGGAAKDDAFASVLFENPGNGNHHLTVRLVGHKTNRFGVGVRLRATIEEPTGTRDVFAFVGTNSSFGGNSLQAEMGMGQAKRLVALEVYWPTTDQTDRFTDVPLDRTIVVEEGVGWRLAPPPTSSR